MTKQQEEFLLGTEYSTDYKIEHGLQPNQSYKRSNNGEHEPRIQEWRNAFKNASLQLNTITVFMKRTRIGFLKILMSHIPYFIRRTIKIGLGLTAHNKYLLYYIFPNLARYGKFKILPIRAKFKTPTAPAGKTILIATKV